MNKCDVKNFRRLFVDDIDRIQRNRNRGKSRITNKPMAKLKRPKIASVRIKTNSCGKRSELVIYQGKTDTGQVFPYVTKQHLRGLRLEVYPEEGLPEAIRLARMARGNRASIAHGGVVIATNEGKLLAQPLVREGNRIYSVMEYRPHLVTLASIIERERKQGGMTYCLQRILRSFAFKLADLHRRRYLLRDRQTGFFRKDEERLQGVYNLHFQDILERLPENFVGMRGTLVGLETYNHLQCLINTSVNRLINQRFRIWPRRGHGDCNPWNIHVPEGATGSSNIIEVDFDHREWIDPASDLSDFALQTDAAFFETGDEFYLEVWRYFFSCYQEGRPDPTIVEAMPPNYGLKTMILHNPEVIDPSRIARFGTSLLVHSTEVLQRERYFPPHP